MRPFCTTLPVGSRSRLRSYNGSSFISVLMWIPSGHKMVDDYIVLVSSTGPIMSGTATFTTNDTAVQISLFYNEEYNISVMANNCAGNSTAAEMNVRIGKISYIHIIYFK